MITKKRFLSILLTLALVLGLMSGMSLTAAAAPATVVQGCNVMIGDETSTVEKSQLPTYTWYRFALTQQICTAEEIGMAGTINSISFYQTENKKLNRSITLYLKHTNKQSFGGSEDWEPVSSADQVYSGSVPITQGWVKITLDTPFAYNGTDNLLVCMDDNSGKDDSLCNFRSSATESYQAMYTYSDGTNFDPGNMTTSSHPLEKFRNVMSLDIHSFTYTADGATITASCGEGCYINDGLTLTISAPTGDLVADGTKTFPATLSTGYNTTAFPEGSISDISYTKDGEAFTGTPTEAGAYVARVTVGDATASVSYTVTLPQEVAGVAEAIANLPAAADVTTADREAIEAARAAYEALDDAQKALVDDDTLQKLTAAESALSTIDQAAAGDVTTAINALPASTDVTADDRADIEAARAAYDALDDTQKALVDTNTLQKLTDVESALSTIDQAAADDVTTAINALPAATNVTADDRANIEAHVRHTMHLTIPRKLL